MIVDPLFKKPENAEIVVGSWDNWRAVAFEFPKSATSLAELIELLKNSVDADYQWLSQKAFEGSKEADALARHTLGCMGLLEMIQSMIRCVPINPTRQEMLDTIARYSRVLALQEANQASFASPPEARM